MKYNPYCKNLNVKVFDIETTGLYFVHDRIISASFCNPDGSELVQYFCDAPQNEDIIVEQIISELSKCDAVITYNGNMFDIPFVLQRAKHNHVAEKLPLFWSIDIYRWLKSYWPMSKQMESLSQKSVEEALGLNENRTDEIGGGECISLYADYVNWNNEKAKELILLHNGDDVRQLARITESLSFLPYHQIVFEKGFLAASFEENSMLGSCIHKVIMGESKFTKTKLSVSAKTDPGLMPTDIFNDSFHLEYDAENGSIKLDIYFKMKDGYKFINVADIFNETGDFLALAGYQSGYLMLAGPNGISYRECNYLISRIIQKYFN